MDIVASFSEYLNTALSFEPALVLSIIMRTLIVSGILLFVIKWIGSKGVSQLTIYQLIIILSLGNIVAEPMINSDTPILSMVTVVRHHHHRSIQAVRLCKCQKQKDGENNKSRSHRIGQGWADG